MGAEIPDVILLNYFLGGKCLLTSEEMFVFFIEARSILINHLAVYVPFKLGI